MWKEVLVALLQCCGYIAVANHKVDLRDSIRSRELLTRSRGASFRIANFSQNNISRGQQVWKLLITFYYYYYYYYYFRHRQIKVSVQWPFPVTGF
jgi:hypothetical protein